MYCATTLSPYDTLAWYVELLLVFCLATTIEPMLTQMMGLGDADGERCLRRGPGTFREILGSTDRTVTGKLQDQSTPRPNASSRGQSVWYLERSCSYSEHDLWTW